MATETESVISMMHLRPSGQGIYTIRIGLLSLLILVVMVVNVSAQEYEDRDSAVSSAFNRSHQLGGRIGGWSNQGVNPPRQIDVASGESYRTDFRSGAFYLEGFFGYRFSSHLMLEFSLGAVSRGDVTLVEFPDTTSSSIGSMMIYPILAKLKFYPLGNARTKFYPYLLAGGGVYYGRHDIQIVTGWEAYFRQTYGSDSETKVSYVLGAGFDWAVATMVALDFQVQYLDARFSGDIIGIRDYSSLTITIGVKHIFRDTSKE